MSLPTTKGIPYPKDLDYTKQSVPVPGTKKPGQTGALLVLLWVEAYLKLTTMQDTIAMVRVDFVMNSVSRLGVDRDAC